MKTEEFEFNYGKLIVDSNEAEDEGFVGDKCISLILNDAFLKKYQCFDINYRGAEGWRLKDKDVRMLFSIQNESDLKC